MTHIHEKSAAKTEFFESLSRLHRIIERRLNTVLRPYQVTSAQYILLKTIIVAPGRKTGARLGAILNLDKTSLSRNLKILEKKGLISRDGFCGRRGKTIQVTPRGLDVLAKTKPVWESAHDGFSVPEEVIVYVKDIVTRLHA